ncbi:DeoR/GlpR family DNA-binding transcription regulator [Deinococcus roseus]|uniref:DeoR family transcriptional regulator n=1 Tax=Deinococcus roseus TaxID=392414 RepID=A0ABQ2CW64_9DEIO|nr:DeoR/GlpR family DNA-binding transcription regulator [Deinococcus roseus]GGJ26823.1 DeoR family transcriptional regulator [Deinococcus roseus]
MLTERHHDLLKLIENRKALRVEEIADLLGVSPATVRRDLRTLQESGMLKRVRGGATAPRAENPSQNTLIEPLDDAFARAMLADISTGEVIILEGERVAPALASHLKDHPRRVTVITNHLQAAQTLQGTSMDVILLGGQLHPRGYTLPEVSSQDIRFLIANQAFIEVEGIHPQAGITVSSPEPARYKRELLGHSMRKNVIALGRNYGIFLPYRVGALEELDTWYTDHLLNPAQVPQNLKIIEVHA